ncbi:MAG: FAD-binding oxidoreductase [Gemmatimonadota bacterium]
MSVRPVVPGTERDLAEVLTDLRPALPGVVVTGSARPHAALRDLGLPGADETGGREPLLVSTSRLSEVVEFRPRDLTVEVGAGMRMRELLRLVEERNLWLPVSGEGLERSVGGWVAAASPSMWDSAFGPVRRQLLGCRMLTPAGKTLNWGRHVMKNVAGYDIPRLLAGSRGRLGILTRVTLRLWPRPAATSLLVRPSDTAGRVADASSGADARTVQVTRDRGRWEILAFTGGESSVRRRAGEFLERARRTGEAGELRIDDPAVIERLGAPARKPGSVVYRLTPGRRYLASCVSALTDEPDAGPTTVQAWPSSGAILAWYDPGQDLERMKALLEEFERSTGSCGAKSGGSVPAIGVDRGGPVEHAWAEARREPSTIAIEQRIEKVFGAWPRSWLADYL